MGPRSGAHDPSAPYDGAPPLRKAKGRRMILDPRNIISPADAGWPRQSL